MGTVQEVAIRRARELRAAEHVVLKSARRLSDVVGLRVVRSHRGTRRVRFPISALVGKFPRRELDAWTRLALALRELDLAEHRFGTACKRELRRGARKGGR